MVNNGTVNQINIKNEISLFPEDMRTDNLVIILFIAMSVFGSVAISKLNTLKNSTAEFLRKWKWGSSNYDK
jgi:hypothetical protein